MHPGGGTWERVFSHSARVAVPGLWKQSDGAAQRPALRGSPCWREGGLGLEKEGKLRASLCSLHHFQSKLRHEEGRVGARRVQTPGGGHPGRRACPGVQSGCLEQRGFVLSLPRRAEQGNRTLFRAWQWSGVQACSGQDTGRFAHGAAWTPSPGSKGQSVNWRCLWGTWTLL